MGRMIISHRHKFAFFRIPKTGSTTVAFMLRMCDVFGDDDVVTNAPVGGFPPINCDPTIRGEDGGTSPHMTPQEAVAAGFIMVAQLQE